MLATTVLARNRPLEAALMASTKTVATAVKPIPN